MTFEPQVPDWGKQLVGDNLDQLIIYHDWLCNTGIKTGLISCLLYTSPSPRDDT